MPTSDVGMLSPGSVVVVPFPYSDRLAEKRRPALVVSGEAAGRLGFVWIAMITSARNTAMAGDLVIEDLAQAGLAVPSVLRPIKITALETSRVLRRIGALHPEETERALDRVRSMIGNP
ncbi:MAG: type II toxin-antitoxin system PemK/MazF family toxin [Methylobacterium sp.]|uniref:type II toxin-antitoxin system PemK/MazF family toxin n=1 Tax=Methylobacterium sp. TaxID=409 RepID=UPI0025DA8D87|nr:type II toxin-antitoxin system PemK/MazF family toxin [Methylobacterium sp.]MBX9932058.1 type II toxin-antitoxin system PemK/MazF family toxin [Methylobacterium sp.]